MAKARDDEDDEDADLDEDPQEADQDAEDEGEELEPCPYCGKGVYEQAEVCPHCKSFISFEDAPPRYRWWLVAGAVVCIVIVVMWVMRYAWTGY